MNVGENIRRIRTAKGIYQADLAKQAGITQAMLSFIERGTKLPSLPVGKLIADALGVTIDDLLGDAK